METVCRVEEETGVVVWLKKCRAALKFRDFFSARTACGFLAKSKGVRRKIKV